MSTIDLLTGVFLAAIKVGVLIAIATTLAWWLRRAPAVARYGVWVAALVGALLLPVVAPWVPSWTLWTLPAPAPAFLASPGSLDSLGSPGSPGSNTSALAPSQGFPPVPVGGIKPCAGCDAQRAVTAAAARSRWNVVLGSIEVARARMAAVPAAIWFLSLWCAGVVIILLRLGRSLLSVRRLESGASPADGVWLEALEDARERVGVRREVRLLRSPEVRTPMTWGALRPVILLPEASRDWDEARRRIVLHHELSHVRRGDWLARLLAQGVCTLYWLNPLVWLAGRRLVLEQEKACDEAVVALGDRPSTYAKHLLAIAASMQRGPLTPTLALDMARRSQMEGRLMSILDRSPRCRASRALLIPALVLIGLVPALAAVDPWAGEAVPGVQTPGATPVAGASLLAPGATSPASGATSPRGMSPAVNTSGVSRVLAELNRLEREMVPFERELETIEAEMEPIEDEMDGVEDRFEPFENELEAIEVELEPYEERLEAMELELEPYEGRLEAVERELEPYEDRLEAFEDELEPYEERLESVEAELEPFEERLEALEDELEPVEDRLEAIEDELEPYEDQMDALEDLLEPLDDEMDRLDDQYEASETEAEREPLRVQVSELRMRMEPLREQMRGVHESMRPVHERMRTIHEEMRPVHERMRSIQEEMRPVHERMRLIHEEMRPVHERMRAIHKEMRPVHERMRSIHEEMRPVHERMRSIHEEMRPVHERMNEIHERMKPVHEAMGEHHERMEPHYRKMAEVHDRMEPLSREMTTQYRAMELELIGVVDRLLDVDLGPVVASGTDFSRAAYEIVDHSSIRIDDSRLRIHSSIPTLRGLLQERFASDAGGSVFEAAVEHFLEAYSNLEIAAL